MAETEVQAPGRYRGRIVDYDLISASESAAKGLSIRAELEEAWIDNEWQAVRKGMYAEGTIWLVKKDRTLNDQQCIAMQDYCGPWDFVSLAQGDFKPKPCGFVIKEDSYKGESRLKIAFLAPWEKSDTTADGEELQNEYGSKLRALLGNGAKAKKPAKAKAKAAADDEEVPF